MRILKSDSLPRQPIQVWRQHLAAIHASLVFIIIVDQKDNDIGLLGRKDFQTQEQTQNNRGSRPVHCPRSIPQETQRVNARMGAGWVLEACPAPLLQNSKRSMNPFSLGFLLPDHSLAFFISVTIRCMASSTLRSRMAECYASNESPEKGSEIDFGGGLLDFSADKSPPNSGRSFALRSATPIVELQPHKNRQCVLRH